MLEQTAKLPGFSYCDHYRWGFNDGWFNDPVPVGFFKNQIGSCSRPHWGFRRECIVAAGLLGQSLTKPILVGLSGGSDSQVVCLSFINANVKFSPVILRLHNGRGQYYNNHDTDGAFRFCQKWNLTPIIEELDLDQYFSGPVWKLIKTVGITVIEIAIQLYLVQKYADTHAYVNGGGDPNISYRRNLDGTSDLVYGLGPTPIQQYMLHNNIQGCLKFFMYTPELIASFLDHPVMHQFNQARDQIYNAYPGKDPFIFVAKPMFYVNEWPELIQQPKNDGFERVPYLKEMRHLVNDIHDHINPRAKKVIWPLDQILDHLLNGRGTNKIWISDWD
jgi:hypothetical protein